MGRGIGFLVLLMLLPVVAAGSVPLLAVSESGGKMVGALANVSLELKEGSGNTFMATSPLTKVDTQISTRLAKEIACKRTAADCSGYDFFYTIRAESPIIGGPSAGAAIAILTLAELERLDIQEGVAVTGTINSGGFIGPVGGIIEKIDAAASHGIHTVLIPKGERAASLNGRNITDVVAYAAGKGVEVQEVSELDAAAWFLAGREYKQVTADIQEDKAYTTIMRSLAEDLCNRSREYQRTFERELPPDELVRQADSHRAEQRYYTAASLCFGANTQYREQQLNEQKLPAKELIDLILQARENSRALDARLAQIPITKITDLETWMISKERIREAEGLIELSQRQAMVNEIQESKKNIAFALERLYTVVLWSRFFNAPGKDLVLNRDIVQAACQERLVEAQDRLEYVRLDIPNAFTGITDKLQNAAQAHDAGDFALCLFEASKAKAEANSVLGAQSADQDVQITIQQKLEIVRKNIVRSQELGLFPIMGYSYYEYAQSLTADDPYAAHLYAEYALELGDLEVYFEKKRPQGRFTLPGQALALLAIGLAGGIIIGVWIRGRSINPRGTARRQPRKGKRGDYKPRRGPQGTPPGKKR
ncbi:MAG TPA: S16 family serine protease [Candidatus Nanoarchaeia archaeon]|nr:S16 family serine protease [Candidatus Nanoarchaeia archaeon]